MHPQWRCRGSKIEYRIARPRADSGRGELGCVGHGGTYQSLGKHCESLPAEVPVQPDAGSPVRSRGRRSRACDESSRPILFRFARHPPHKPDSPASWASLPMHRPYSAGNGHFLDGRFEPNAATRSCIGSGMSIVGNIECNGPAQVFGQIKGEVRASDLLIGDGAQIEGTVISQNVTVCGCVKGTIRAVRVKLQNGGAVEGDIFHRSLSIEENSLFEGSSRRVENPTDLPSVEAKGPQEEDMQNSALAPYLQRDEAHIR